MLEDEQIPDQLRKRLLSEWPRLLKCKEIRRPLQDKTFEACLKSKTYCESLGGLNCKKVRRELPEEPDPIKSLFDSNRAALDKSVKNSGNGSHLAAAAQSSLGATPRAFILPSGLAQSRSAPDRASPAPGRQIPQCGKSRAGVHLMPDHVRIVGW